MKHHNADVARLWFDEYEAGRIKHWRLEYRTEVIADVWRESLQPSFTTYPKYRMTKLLTHPDYTSEPKLGQLVWARDYEIDSWVVGYYAGTNEDPNGIYHTTSASKDLALNGRGLHYRLITTVDPYP